MALDGLAVCALASEFSAKLLNGKIDKIHQPERDEITLSIKTNNGVLRLLLCANASFPRAHLIDYSKENPQKPPMFCMLLRKHLGGGKITAVYQHEFERIIKFEIEALDEMYDISKKTLIIEIMGKHSNIVLVDRDGKIIDSIFHVDASISSIRQILPGLLYKYPPSQEKSNILTLSSNQICEILQKNSDIHASKLIMNSFMGISPIISRELAYRAFGSVDKIFDANADDVKKLCFVLEKFANDIRSKHFSPGILIENDSNTPMDFSAECISQYENAARFEKYQSISEAANDFYVKKAMAHSIKQKTSDLAKHINTNLDRCYKKIQILAETIKKAEDREKYKMYGDLITANIYRLKTGMEECVVENFYTQNSEMIKIPLKSDLSPSQNAQRYYIKYTKEKTALEQATLQIDLAKKEAQYLETVALSINDAQTRDEIAQIREELVEEGYLKNKERQKKKSFAPSPMHFKSDDGFEIVVGKNNKQNDYVTFKVARSSDIWLHTKGIHGSHAIIKTGGKKVPDSTVVYAASLAAYYSKGRNSQNVPVDYTEVKNVKKPNGAKPGMVIYVNYKTVYVTPCAHFE